MASSLQKLLAEDGFRRKGLMAKSRPSFRAEQGRKSSVKVKTQRAKSDVGRHNPVAEHYDTVADGKDEGFREHFVRTKNEKVEIFFGGESYGEEKGISTVHTSPEDMKGNNEIVEVNEEEDDRVYEEVIINWNKAQNSHRGKEIFSDGADHDQEILEIHEHKSSAKNAVNKKLGHGYITCSSEPALDKVAVQALISIFTEYIKRFLKDEDFRITLRDNCFSSLHFFEIQEGNSTETKIIMSLEKAIETVERALEESIHPKELKKASVQLSVITGLSLNDSKNRSVTCGLPNYNLSACAHLYLSVIYTIQKKDRVSAKHLLQVFCDSPFQARTALLPDLWDDMFFPHLEEFKAWYVDEAHSLSADPKSARKLKQHVKLYNEILDSWTCEFAMYYKDWLTEGAETPSFPCIEIPSKSLCEDGYEDSPSQYLATTTSSSGSFSPQPMVSKKLYDAVFSVLRDNSYEHERL